MRLLGTPRSPSSPARPPSRSRGCCCSVGSARSAERLITKSPFAACARWKCGSSCTFFTPSNCVVSFPRDKVPPQPSKKAAIACNDSWLRGDGGGAFGSCSFFFFFLLGSVRDAVRAAPAGSRPPAGSTTTWSERPPSPPATLKPAMQSCSFFTPSKALDRVSSSTAPPLAATKSWMLCTFSSGSGSKLATGSRGLFRGAGAAVGMLTAPKVLNVPGMVAAFATSAACPIGCADAHMVLASRLTM
mmetsp:Transcript_56386/g.164843  ORF Transcript_56386/g.164843 Transcript_56386/m.164843 type:complete len:245 (-) Transcript_56386:462-1196(-)